MAIRSAAGTAAIVLILAAVAACGGASGSPKATASSSPVETPTAAGASSPTPPSTAGPLEDLLPDEVDGIALTTKTILGPDIGELEPAEAANFGAILQNVDGPPESFAVASATGEGLAIAAWRMEGTDGRQLGESYIGFIVGSSATKVEDITIGGKAVKRVTPASTTPLHVYVTGEVMFVVQAAKPELVPEVFAVLP
jgi:hypothetical protein